MHRAQPIRIPVSLAFEKNSDFYQEFILDLKDQRQLSTLIVDLLYAYYQDKDLKSIMDVVITSDDPMSAVRDQISRVKMEHNKNMMTTSMLHQHTKDSLEDVESQMQGTSPEHTDNSSPHLLEAGASQHSTPVVEEKLSDGVLSRLSALESALPSIDQKLSDLVSLMSKREYPSGGSPVSSETPVSNVSHPPQTHENAKFSDNVDASSSQNDVNSAVSDSISELSLIIESGSDENKEQDSEEDQGITIGSVDEDAEDSQDVEAVTVPPQDQPEKKPPSFGRALKSIKGN